MLRQKCFFNFYLKEGIILSLFYLSFWFAGLGGGGGAGGLSSNVRETSCVICVLTSENAFIFLFSHTCLNNVF